MNSSFYGQLFPRTVRDDYRFIIHEHEDILGDGREHTWFEYIPEAVRKAPGQQFFQEAAVIIQPWIHVLIPKDIVRCGGMDQDEPFLLRQLMELDQE